MTTEAGFLDAIIHHPDDDTPRLVFADWLEDNGDPYRAEFIRAQLALARLPDDAPEAEPLREREQALLDEHRARWVPALGRLGKTHAFFRRGLVEAVSLTPAQLLTLGPELFRRAPVTALTLKTSGDLAGVAAMPEVEGVRLLELTGRTPSRARLEALFRSPRLAGLRSLDLSELGGEQPVATRALITSPLLARLNELDLSNGSVDPALLGPLLEGATAGLTKLALRHNPLGSDGARVLAASPHLATLEDLDLAYTNLTSDAGAPLAGSLYLRRLRRLCLHFNTLHGPGSTALAASPILAHVIDLDIGFNEITDEGAIALARSPYTGQVRVLNLNHSEMSSRGLEAIARSPLLGQLRELLLAYNQIDDDGVAALAAAPGLASLRRLNLSDNEFGRAGVTALAESPHAAGLTFLDVESNRIRVEGARALARSPHLANLRGLHVGSADMGQRGVAALRKRFGVRLTIY